MSVPAPPRLDASIVWLDEVDSTNAVAIRLVGGREDAGDGESSDVLVVAGAQTEGRGRGGNRWLSPPGGIYASLVSTVPPAALACVPMAAGVAAAAAAEGLVAGLEVRLKWPNDLLVAGRKLGGVLCQSRTSAARSVVVVGVGVNVTPVATDGPAIGATSLCEAGFEGSSDGVLWPFLARFLAGFRSAVGDPAGLQRDWVARSTHASGDRLRFRWSGGEVSGVFRGFGDDGALVLDVDGETRRFATGELVGPLAGGG